MLTERLQVLITPEQRRRLEAEARRNGSSVGGLVRAAIDARFGGAEQNERLQALDRIKAMHGEFLPPDELDRVADEERTKRFLRHLPG